VGYLIHEININKTIRNNEGKTPLDIAQEADHQEVVRYMYAVTDPDCFRERGVVIKGA
jgi:hypothetical protein